MFSPDISETSINKMSAQLPNSSHYRVERVLLITPPPPLYLKGYAADYLSGFFILPSSSFQVTRNKQNITTLSLLLLVFFNEPTPAYIPKINKRQILKKNQG
ncbi:hypothetical protein CHARACLAT_012364 [Characodon lateralis]|uniref:Uncharacterized protein n=1 Tax=Characodon lateralis TaxID=208331 RepID=A0ABU7F5M4_9TELE|nr:hypothetical protein [Characodon lateralis]